METDTPNGCGSLSDKIFAEEEDAVRVTLMNMPDHADFGMGPVSATTNDLLRKYIPRRSNRSRPLPLVRVIRAHVAADFVALAESCSAVKVLLPEVEYDEHLDVEELLAMRAFHRLRSGIERLRNAVADVLASVDKSSLVELDTDAGRAVLRLRNLLTRHTGRVESIGWVARFALKAAAAHPDAFAAYIEKTHQPYESEAESDASPEPDTA